MLDKKYETSPAYRKGDNVSIKTAIVLSAPGEAEEKAGRPAAGQTGKTLQIFIEMMNKRCRKKFPSNKLDDYTIVNAVEDVHSKKRTGRTEGANVEVCEKSNINRIRLALCDVEDVVALGHKASLAVKTSKFRGRICEAEHPSMQSLNRKYSSKKLTKSRKLTPPGRHKIRVCLWALKIIRCYKMHNKNLVGPKSDVK